MEIRKLTLSFKLKSTKETNIGIWSGSKLRAALKNSIIHAYCYNMERGACDKCKHMDCANKIVFDASTEDKARMSCNPVIIGCKFSDEDEITDNINVNISLLGKAMMAKQNIIDAFTYGIFLGAERTHFKLDSYTEAMESFNIDKLSESDTSKSDKTITVKFDTPFVTKSTSGLTLESFIRNCTTRITSVVNALEMEYTVEYQKAIDSLCGISLKEIKTQDKYYGKLSSRTKRFNTIHGHSGEMTIAGDLSNVYKYIELASHLNIGKHCSMGFGEFSITERE